MNVCLLVFLIFSSAAISQEQTNPWMNDEKIQDDIDAFIEKDKVAVDASELLQRVPKTCEVDCVQVKKEPLNNLYETCAISVVAISRSGYCKKCKKKHGKSLGTGFFISEDGAVVTNYHIVDHEEGAYYVTTYDGTTYPVIQLLSANKSDDLAILKLEPVDDTTFIPLPLQTEANVGNKVWVIGHPDHRFFTLTEGIISRYRKTVPEQSNEATIYEMMITAQFSPGSSGGPVFDRQGNVIAIVKSRESVGSARRKGHDTATIPTQIAHACIPVNRLLQLIEQ